MSIWSEVRGSYSLSLPCVMLSTDSIHKMVTEGEQLEKSIRQLQQRIARLEEALDGLMEATKPVKEFETARAIHCPVCEFWWEGEPDHAPGCAWVAAQKAREEKEL